MKKGIISLAAFILLSMLNAQGPIYATSRISETGRSTMSITRNDLNEIIINTTISNAENNDRFRIFLYGPTYSNGVISIPDDEKTYWEINFDPSVGDPVKLISFGEMTADCHCPSRTDCNTEVCGQAVEQDGIVVCPPGACSGWDPETECGSCDLPLAIIIVDADAIYYNGKKYKKQ